MELNYIQEILGGNVSRFSYFVTTYKDMAYSVAFRIVKNNEDAEEIVQDSFVKAYKALHKFRKESKFSTWFYRIVVNNALTRKKAISYQVSDANSSEISNVQMEEIESAYKNLTQLERQKFINNALEKIPEEDSLLLTLFYLNENSIEEISEITGISKGNLKMKLLRAREKMYLALQKSLKFEIQSLL